MNLPGQLLPAWGIIYRLPTRQGAIFVAWGYVWWPPTEPAELAGWLGRLAGWLAGWLAGLAGLKSSVPCSACTKAFLRSAFLGGTLYRLDLLRKDGPGLGNYRKLKESKGKYKESHTK